MFRFLFYLALGWGIYYLVRSLFSGAGRAARKASEARDGVDDEMVSCPECATFFPSLMGVSGKARGVRRSFCSGACAEKFARRGGPPEG